MSETDTKKVGFTAALGIERILLVFASEMASVDLFVRAAESVGARGRKWLPSETSPCHVTAQMRSSRAANRHSSAVPRGQLPKFPSCRVAEFQLNPSSPPNWADSLLFIYSQHTQSRPS